MATTPEKKEAAETVEYSVKNVSKGHRSFNWRAGTGVKSTRIDGSEGAEVCDAKRLALPRGTKVVITKDIHSMMESNAPFREMVNNGDFEITPAFK